MKKTFIRISTFALTLVLLLCFVSCVPLAPKDKSFSKAGLTITLTEEFSEQELVTQTAYYVSQKAIVTTLKEDGSSISDYTVKQYAELVISVNNLANTTATEKDGYAEFTYEKNLNGKDYYYYARCFKNGTDFWLVQFSCETKNTETLTPSFEKWASSITFSS
ncbi:MAG: hypothetical protein IJ459_07255 [Clostridia bacterium]|nr:hypothetical protein [Clostridia bacterium]